MRANAFVKYVLSRYYLGMNENEIFNYVERLSNLLRNEMRGEGAEPGLLPVQLEALYYLSICNRYSDIPMGVTEYLGQTKGTVSQTLKVLEKKGLISKHPDANDKRLTHLRLTREGAAVLNKSMPPPKFASACKGMDEADKAQLMESLKALLAALQTENEMQSFGVCKQCMHNTQTGEQSYFCNLTQESLSNVDVEQICREYTSS